eukprot:comp22517_c0_seq1/m.34125 comp22517_c0_seq1/g.34125  ORF comp22517_c0_seq1/g.34125 comp22517_c0_seq1/m.34125 type:complete len:536 (-) comp22517_c0_seq1:238-1845(-)
MSRVLSTLGLDDAPGTTKRKDLVPELGGSRMRLFTRLFILFVLAYLLLRTGVTTRYTSITPRFHLIGAAPVQATPCPWNIGGIVELAMYYHIEFPSSTSSCPKVGEIFKFSITNKNQEPGTQDELYIKVVSENTRQVATVVPGPIICVNTTETDGGDELITPQNSWKDQEPTLNERNVYQCSRKYVVSFIPAEVGAHKLVFRLLMKDVPTPHLVAPCQGCPPDNPSYRTRRNGTLAVVPMSVSPGRVSSASLPVCNYSGLSEGVWFKKGNLPPRLAGMFATTLADGFWLDPFVWVPAIGGLCSPRATALSKRQLSAESVIAALQRADVSNILILGDSITREFYYDLALLLSQPESPFEWGSVEKSQDHRPVTPMRPGAPQLQYKFFGNTCPLPVINNTEQRCSETDTIIVSHGLWSVFYRTADVTLSEIRTCILEPLVRECHHVLANGKAYWLAMPSTPSTSYYRIPERVRQWNQQIEQLVISYGFKVIDTYHWSQGRPEGSGDATHFGAWSKLAFPLYLSRATLDLWLADVLSL